MSDQHQKCTMPLVLTKGEWSRIGNWTNKERDDPDAKRRRDYVNYLDVTSREMTKSWPNSLENVNRRNEELRRERHEASEQANSRFYKKYLRTKKEQQERLMHSARDVIFKNKDAPKLMLSAVIASCTMQERAAQVEFLRGLRRREAEQARADDAEVARRATHWHAHVGQQRRRRREVNKLHQRDIVEQAHEISERKRKEYEEELKMQIQDNITANEQMKAIKDYEDKFRSAEKARILADLKQEANEIQQRKAEREAKERMEDRLIEVLNKSRARIERLRRKTENDERAAKLKVLEAISSKLESGDAARDAHEQDILEAASKKVTKDEDARLRATAEQADKLRAERRADRKQWLQHEEQRANEAKNMLHWDCVNRFKNMELTADYNKKNRDREQQKINQFRDDMLMQMKERSSREAAALAETRHFYGARAEAALRAADEKVLEHARALLREARDHGRPDLPLRDAVHRYCTMNRLYPPPSPPRSLRAHYPRFTARDHPRYRPPPLDLDELLRLSPKVSTVPAPSPPRSLRAHYPRFTARDHPRYRPPPLDLDELLRLSPKVSTVPAPSPPRSLRAHYPRFTARDHPRYRPPPLDLDELLRLSPKVSTVPAPSPPRSLRAHYPRFTARDHPRYRPPPLDLDELLRLSPKVSTVPAPSPPRSLRAHYPRFTARDHPRYRPPPLDLDELLRLSPKVSTVPAPSPPRSLRAHYPRFTARDHPRYRPPPLDLDELLRLSPKATSNKKEETVTSDNKKEMVMPTKEEVPVKPEGAPADYRRVGRADGLQIKHVPKQMALDTVTVIPCKASDCNCALRK